MNCTFWRPENQTVDSQNVLFIACLFQKFAEQDHANFTILTTEASEKVKFCHSRMPVIFTRESDALEWLKGQNPREGLKLLKPVKNVAYHHVSSFVNNTKNNSEECITEIEDKVNLKRATASAQMSITGFLRKEKAPKVEES